MSKYQVGSDRAHPCWSYKAIVILNRSKIVDSQLITIFTEDLAEIGSFGSSAGLRGSTLPEPEPTANGCACGDPKWGSGNDRRRRGGGGGLSEP